MSAPPAFLVAGALAGACASGMTTPFDVLKTRVGVRLPLRKDRDRQGGIEGEKGGGLPCV